MVDIEDVRSYWEANPLSASAIPHPLGTPEYFAHYDRLREANEPLEFSYRLHEYRAFAGKNVLDVGCGNGYVLSKYAQEGAETTGVDLTEVAVDLSRRRFELLGLTGDFHVASAEALPFGDDTFDCVCSMGVVHHTPDTPRAVAEIRRVLRPGGRLILMVYHRNSALYQVNFRILRGATGKPMQQLVDEVDGTGNPKGDVYSRRELRELLSGFERLELFVDLLQPWMVAPRFAARLPPGLFRPFAPLFGWFLYAKGFKPRA